MSQALVVIDVQQGMWSEGAPHDGEAVVRRIRDLIAKARAARVPVWYVQHDSGPEGPLNAGTPGFDVHADLAPQPGDPVTVKSVCSAFRDTDLDARLKADSIDALVICGMQTEYCIDTNVRIAHERGYDVTLVADGHTTGDGRLPAAHIIRHHNGILWDFAKVKPAAEISF